MNKIAKMSELFQCSQHTNTLKKDIKYAYIKVEH